MQTFEAIKRTKLTKVDVLQTQATLLDNQHLVLFSSNMPDKDDFASMLKCLHVEYEFGEHVDDPNSACVDFLIGVLEDMTSKTPRQQGFQSIALACHGPEISRSNHSFIWEISYLLRVTDHKDLLDMQNPVRRFVDALAGMSSFV